MGYWRERARLRDQSRCVSQKSSAKQRLFFALWPHETLRQRILETAASFDAGGKPVTANNLHITLVFVGSVNAGQRRCVEKTATALPVPSPFELKIDRAGTFKRIAFWLGPGEIPQPLSELNHNLNKLLESDCGYQPEKRDYKPHITIQRKIAAPLPTTKLEKTILWPVNSFSLVISESAAKGSVYRELRRWSL